MSYRQFKILFACLVGVLSSAAAVSAQDRVQLQPAEPSGMPTEEHRAGASYQPAKRGEPAPLRHGGFIQQLRAVPPSPTQILQEADERAVRLPARAISTQQLPPTYSELQNRSTLSRRLRVKQGWLGDAAGVQDSRLEPTSSDRSPVVDAKATASYQSADPYIVAASTESDPKSTDADADVRSRHSYVLLERNDESPVPRNQAFDALTAESLQQAPRVSRVPLPRPAQQTSRISQSSEAPPQRVAATPVSAMPQLGGTRASNATMRTTSRDDRTIPEVSPQADSTPSAMAPTATSRQQDAASQRSTTLELPSLPGAVSSRDLDAGVAFDADRQPGGGMQPSGNALPDLPAFTDSSQSTTGNSPPVRRGESSATTEMTMPSFGAGLPELSLPEASLSDTQRSQQPSGHTSRSPELATDNAVRVPNRKPSVGSPAQTLDSPAQTTDTAQRLKMEAPRLSVVLNGPSDLPIGSPADYQIVVRNQDSFDLKGLILRLDIPAGVKVQTRKPTHGEFELETAADGLTMVTWGFEQLAAGQTATAPMQLIAGSAKNFAVAMEWTLMPMAGSSAISVRAPQLELALEGPAEVRFGEPNVYRLHIRNPGNAPAEQIAVRLSAERFGSSAAEVARIAPGEEEVIDVELTFNERGSINIDAVAQEQTGLSSQTAIAVVVRQAIIESQLLTAPLVYHSALTECSVRLSNQGDADARALQAVLELPEGAGLVSTPKGAVLNDRKLTWTVDKLIAGSSEEFVVQLKLTSPGANRLSLLCSGPGNVNSTAQAVTQVESITDLKLFVEAPLAPAPVGGEVTYELTLTNRGSKAATNVIVVAQFSDGIEPIRSEGQAARVVPGQALFEPLPRLAAGETVNLKVIAQAAAAGSHRFRVEVRSDDSQVRLVQEESTQYLEPASRIAAPRSSSSSLR